MYVFGCCELFFWFFFFKQKTAYEMRISDWSSDVCSSDLVGVVEAAADDEGAVDHHQLVVELAEPVLARGEPGLAAAIGDHASRSPVAVALAGIEDAANLDAALGDGDQRVVDAGRLGEGEDREVDTLLRLQDLLHDFHFRRVIRCKEGAHRDAVDGDRKSTRLNSSH